MCMCFGTWGKPTQVQKNMNPAAVGLTSNRQLNHYFKLFK